MNLLYATGDEKGNKWAQCQYMPKIGRIGVVFPAFTCKYEKSAKNLHTVTREAKFNLAELY